MTRKEATRRIKMMLRNLRLSPNDDTKPIRARDVHNRIAELRRETK